MNRRQHRTTDSLPVDQEARTEDHSTWLRPIITYRSRRLGATIKFDLTARLRARVPIVKRRTAIDLEFSTVKVCGRERSTLEIRAAIYAAKRDDARRCDLERERKPSAVETRQSWKASVVCRLFADSFSTAIIFLRNSLMLQERALIPSDFSWTAMLSSFRTTDATVPRRPDAYATTTRPLFFIPLGLKQTPQVEKERPRPDVHRVCSWTWSRSEASQREPVRTGYRRNSGDEIPAAWHTVASRRSCDRTMTSNVASLFGRPMTYFENLWRTRLKWTEVASFRYFPSRTSSLLSV